MIFLILAIWASIGWVLLYRFMPETCEVSIPIEPKKILNQYVLVLKNWQFVKPILTLSLSFSALIAWIAAGPFLVMNTFHYSPITFGILQGLVFGSIILGNHLVRYFIEKVSMDKIITISLGIVIIAGLFGFFLSIFVKEYLVDIVITMMVFAFGSSIGFPVFQRLAVEGSSAPMGIKMALVTSFMGIFALVGSLCALYTGTVFAFLTLILLFSLALFVINHKMLGFHLKRAKEK